MSGRRAREERNRRQQERLAAAPPGVSDPALFLVVQGELYGVTLATLNLPLDAMAAQVARARALGPSIDAERAAAASENLGMVERMLRAVRPLQELAAAAADPEALVTFDAAQAGADRTSIVVWLRGLAGHAACPEERRAWYLGVAIDIEASADRGPDRPPPDRRRTRLAELGKRWREQEGLTAADLDELAALAELIGAE